MGLDADEPIARVLPEWLGWATAVISPLGVPALDPTLLGIFGNVLLAFGIILARALIF